MTGASNRAGATAGDALIFLATLSLAAALLYPAWSARTSRDRFARAATDVESVAAAARSVLTTSGAWPTPTAPGQAPPELGGLAGQDQPFGRVDYALEWTSWSVVDSIDALTDIVITPGDAPPDSVGPVQRPVVRRVGAVALHSGDPALLAEMAERFADESSFVLDTIWMLVLPDRASTPAVP